MLTIFKGFAGVVIALMMAVAMNAHAGNPDGNSPLKGRGDFDGADDYYIKNKGVKAWIKNEKTTIKTIKNNIKDNKKFLKRYNSEQRVAQKNNDNRKKDYLNRLIAERQEDSSIFEKGLKHTKGRLKHVRKNKNKF